MQQETDDEALLAELNLMVAFLKECVMEEKLVERLMIILSREKETKDFRLLDVESMVIDSLHLANRTIERLIKILLEHGFSYWDNQQGDFFESVEALVNTMDLENDDPPLDVDGPLTIQRNLWTCPRGEAGKTDIGEVKMSEKAAKKFLESIEKLYPVCLPLQDQQRDTFIELIAIFKDIIVTLDRKEEFSDEQINNLQAKIDLHSELWIDLAGIDGQTNYYHYLSSGHVAYFLFKYP